MILISILSYIINKILCEPNKILLDLYLRSMIGSYDSNINPKLHYK